MNILKVVSTCIICLWITSCEKKNATSLPRQGFGINLGSNKKEIKNKFPTIIENSETYLYYLHPQPDIKGVFFYLSKEKKPVLTTIGIDYDKSYSAKLSFKQFRAKLENLYGPSSEYMNDREYYKEQVYWKDGRTRIVAGQVGDEYFLRYEDLTRQ